MSCHFLSPSAYPINFFFAVMHMYKIHVFDEAFFFLAKVAMITDRVDFSSFHIKYCKGINFFQGNHAAHQSKVPEEIESNR